MDTSIHISEREVMSSGSVVVINDEPVTFYFIEGAEFIVVFRFIHDSDQTGKKRSAEVIDNRLVITFLNYEDQLGVANSETIELGTLAGSRIFVNYAFYFIGDVAKHARVIHYTFLRSSQLKGNLT